MKKPPVLIASMLAAFALIFATVDRNTVAFVIASGRDGEAPDREKERIVATVKTFNLILTDFYASGGKHALLDNFPATTLVKHDIFRDLGYIKSANRVLVYDHASTTPMKVLLTAPDRAEALVFEEWNYMYQKVDDRTPLTRTAGFGQGFRYHLVRERGRWVVNGWDPEQVAEPSKKKEFLF